MREKMRKRTMTVLPLVAVVLTHLYYQRKIEKLNDKYVENYAYYISTGWKEGFAVAQNMEKLRRMNTYPSSDSGPKIHPTENGKGCIIY